MDRKELNRYVEETLGGLIEWRPGGAIPGLSQHFKLSFEISKGRLLGTDCLFLLGDRAKEFPVPVLERQLATLKERTQFPLVLVFDQLPGRTAERLVKRRISFVVVGRQLYLPFLLAHLRKEPTRSHSVPDSKPLSPAAESILVGQLLGARFQSKIGAEVAKVLKHSVMTASKAIRELEERGLCQLQIVGRRKLLSFEERAVLWESAKKILRNPVQSIKYLDTKPNVPWALAGLSALSKQSLLAEDRQQTIAIYRRDIFQSKNPNSLQSLDSESSSYKIEVWNRKPWLFSNDKTIDPISLYLTLRSEPDERVQTELAGVMKRIGLPIHGESNG